MAPTENGATAQRIALVTGAGSGIGQAVALAFLAEGWDVVLAGRRREALEETLAASSDAARAMVHPTDVADPASVDSLFSAIKDRFGRLDVLFNNAGVNASASPDALTFEQWTSVVSINLTGSFLCAQGAFRLMREQSPQGGRIINNGSISAHAPRPNSIAYTATKHAVTGLTKSLSLDGRRYGISCGQIDVGNALTPMAARMQTGVPQANGETAIEPVMDVDNVARTVLFMASLPPEANMQSVMIMASAMPFVGRG
jgi:NAD(P)-dependent dehydrogenase (short-subunit alcohol dehydrogenase family)